VLRDKRCSVVVAGAEQNLFTLSPNEKQLDSLRMDAADTRAGLHRKAYKHKTSLKLDYHMRRVLELMEPHIKIPGTGGRMMTMSEAAVEFDMEAFQYVDDSLVRQMLRTPMPELKPAQDEYHRRFSRRQIAIYVEEVELEAPMNFSKVRAELVAEYNERRLQPEHGQAKELDVSEVILQPVVLGHGMKSEDPAKNILFHNSKQLERYEEQQGSKLKIYDCPDVVRHDHGVPLRKRYRVICFFDPELPMSPQYTKEDSFNLLATVFDAYMQSHKGRLVRMGGTPDQSQKKRRLRLQDSAEETLFVSNE